MEGFGWILTIILGAIAGWIAENLMKSEHGLMMNIILGVIGAVVGNFLMRLLFDATLYGMLGQIIVAVIGACLLIWIGRLVRGRG